MKSKLVKESLGYEHEWNLIYDLVAKMCQEQTVSEEDLQLVIEDIYENPDAYFGEVEYDQVQDAAWAAWEDNKEDLEARLKG